MIYKSINSGKDPLFKKCWEIYCSNFPLNERRDLLEQKRIFETYCNTDKEENNSFNFIALLKTEDNNKHIGGEVTIIDNTPCILVGIITYWNFSEVVFAEHLAISKNVQGIGIGKIAIDYLKRCAALKFNNKPIILEIEVPNDFMTKRRESFYKKLDFNINTHEHFQPCFHKEDEPIEMQIMSWPQIIDNHTYNRFNREQLEIMPKF